MKFRTLIAVAAALLLVASCTSGSEGLFASVEREQKIADAGNLNNNTTVTHMAEFGGKYWAAGGRALFSRDVGASDWASTVSLNGQEPRNFMAVGSTSTRLYAIVNDRDSSTNKLYWSTNGSTWTQETAVGNALEDLLVPVRQPDGVTSTELVVTNSDLQRVYLLTGSSVTTADLGTPGLTVTAAASTGTEYYVLSDMFLSYLNGSFVYQSQVDLTAVNTNGHGYRGLVILTDAGVPAGLQGTYLSTKKGYLAKGTLAAGVWSATTLLGSDLKHNSDVVALDQFLYQGTAGNEALWVGTGSASSAEGYGFASVSSVPSLSFLPPASTDSNNFTSSGLNAFRTPLLFKGSTGYFLGTLAHGLWSWDSAKKTWSRQ